MSFPQIYFFGTILAKLQGTLYRKRPDTILLPSLRSGAIHILFSFFRTKETDRSSEKEYV